MKQTLNQKEQWQAIIKTIRKNNIDLYIQGNYHKIQELQWRHKNTTTAYTENKIQFNDNNEQKEGFIEIKTNDEKLTKQIQEALKQTPGNLHYFTQLEHNTITIIFDENSWILKHLKRGGGTEIFC